MKRTPFRPFFYFAGLALALACAASCIRYQPQPIEPAKGIRDFAARRLDSPELGELLLQYEETREWPPAEWDLKSLTLAALYFHPDMDVARAQWSVAQAGRITAGERPNPALNPALGYNSTTPAGEATPWIPEISLDISLETAGKRGLRIAEARHLSSAARLNILKTAWDVRSRLRTALIEACASGARESLLTAARALQEKVVQLLEVQSAVGNASAYDVTQARIALDGCRLAAIEAVRAKEEALARLAAAIGLPRKALEGARLACDSLRAPPPDFPTAELHRRAVLNRSDILAALAEYAASESALRLEIAKQHPDIRLGPNYQFDQTDNKWTVGLSIDLPILSHNRGPIAEAEARRTESAARLLSLQSQVIGELDAAVEECRSALGKYQAAEDLLAHLDRQAKAARAKHELGQISLLERLGVELELNSGAQSRLDALVQSQEAVGRLENAAQSPLNVKEWMYTKARRNTSPDKELQDD